MRTRACSPPERLEMGAIELAGIEEEAFGPGGDVDGAVLKDDGIAVRAESLAEGLFAI